MQIKMSASGKLSKKEELLQKLSQYEGTIIATSSMQSQFDFYYTDNTKKNIKVRSGVWRGYKNNQLTVSELEELFNDIKNGIVIPKQTSTSQQNIKPIPPVNIKTYQDINQALNDNIIPLTDIDSFDMFNLLPNNIKSYVLLNAFPNKFTIDPNDLSADYLLSLDNPKENIIIYDLSSSDILTSIQINELFKDLVEIEKSKTLKTANKDLNINLIIQNNIPTMSTITSTSSIPTLKKVDIDVLKQRIIPDSATYNLEQDLKEYNEYVLFQIANKNPIDIDLLKTVRSRYPFIVSDAIERNTMGYNGIINSGIRSNIPVDFRNITVPIPDFSVSVKQAQEEQKLKDIQTNLQKAIDRGYQIVSTKNGFSDEFISFKQKGVNKFEGSYRHPKLKGKFRVIYNSNNNTFVITNSNYPTGYVKTGFQIYSYLNSLVKKQTPKPQVYMPRVVVNS